MALLASTLAAPMWVQSTEGQLAPAAGHGKIPDWQTAAGSKMAFDVASVKRDTATPSEETVHTNVPLGPAAFFSPTGGRFSASNLELYRYMIFAYKLTNEQIPAVQSQLPKWANTNRYDIEARASGNPTKDQYRLMMQVCLRIASNSHITTRPSRFRCSRLYWISPGN
jgi:hypothetical protein